MYISKYNKVNNDWILKTQTWQSRYLLNADPQVLRVIDASAAYAEFPGFAVQKYAHNMIRIYLRTKNV